MLDSLARFLRARTQVWILVTGTLLLPALGFLDVLTGVEISFSIFYLFPVFLVSWFMGRWPGFAVSCLAATVWLLAELLGGSTYSHPATPFWNMGVRLFVFILVAWLLSEVQLREARRRALERIFFHDILNTTTGVRGFAEYLQDCAPADQKEICATILAAAEQMTREIEGQRILSAAENHDLPIEPTVLNSRLLLEQVLAWYGHGNEDEKAAVCLASESEEITFSSDQALLSRVLGNMIKNALEATQPGETVTAGCRKSGENVAFWVHNPQHIPARVQAHIFQPSFSTKGKDRGLGAYSMRLLSHELGGDVSFTSSPHEGTTFFARFPLRPKPPRGTGAMPPR